MYTDRDSYSEFAHILYTPFTLNSYSDCDFEYVQRPRLKMIYTYTATMILYTDRDFEVVQRQFSEVVPATVL